MREEERRRTGVERIEEKEGREDSFVFFKNRRENESQRKINYRGKGGG